MFRPFPGTLAFQVDVEGKAEGIFYIEIKDGQLHVEPYDYHDRNARLIINGTNLMKLVNGKLGIRCWLSPPAS